ncbi:MAG: hypothetical protein QOJ15_5081 [Bradyrhizobium sp.]|jgi:hypothetical protein|nr:hypothetical protein [Bradyrhizobium sp.]
MIFMSVVAYAVRYSVIHAYWSKNTREPDTSTNFTLEQL